MDFDVFPVHLHAAAGDPVRAEDGPDALAAPGAQQAGKAVDLALVDGEVDN